MSAVIEAPWWKTAPNPPCWSECQSDHRSVEFAEGGGMLCIHHLIDTSSTHVIDVQSYTGTNDAEDGYESDPTAIYFADLTNEPLTPDVAEAMGRDLLTAARMAREFNDRAVTAR